MSGLACSQLCSGAGHVGFLNLSRCCKCHKYAGCTLAKSPVCVCVNPHEAQCATPHFVRPCIVVTCDCAGCIDNGQSCSSDAQCCSNVCNNQTNKCDFANCFAGDTLVHIREASEPIPIRDLRTGQHVMCLDTTEDLRAPRKAAYCQVRNWVGASLVLPIQPGSAAVMDRGRDWSRTWPGLVRQGPLDLADRQPTVCMQQLLVHQHKCVVT